LKETGAQKATLEQAIAILNGEIALQQLQINQTQWEISGLEGEINELSQRIEGLGYSLDRLGTVLIERVRTQYKQSRSAPALRLLGIESLSDLVTQMKYLVLAQRQTADTMERTETQRLEYDEQKQIKEQKQQELEAKRNKLLTQRQELEQTQAEKRVLLANTQNNERRYQQLLADAQRELRQISQAANVVIREGNGVSVSRGEVIGTMGQLPDGAITLIETLADVSALVPPEGRPLAFVTQTTLSVEDTAGVIRALQDKFSQIQAPAAESICYATTNRQEAVKEAAPGADFFLVVGAPNSSNSRRLVEVAERAGAARALLVQREAEIPWAELGDISVLGLSAGASAPEIIIDEIIEGFRARYDVTVDVVITAEETENFPVMSVLRDVELTTADMAFVNGSV